jgi:SAM-dependent methyltransferase
MDRFTRDFLDALNRDFYRRYAREFSATRESPWPGFLRVLELFRSRHERGSRPRILDLGCGNGRLLRLLEAAPEPDFEYLGLDSSPALLAEARRRSRGPAPPARRVGWCCARAGATGLALRPAAFQAVFAFAILHHLPGRESRRRALEELAAVLAPGGFLALSFWRFRQVVRLRRRIVPWAEVLRRHALAPGDLELEEGDFVLRFGTDQGALRYCHHADAAERAALVAGLGLFERDRFVADGREQCLNEYLVLERPAADQRTEALGSGSR